MAKSKTKKSNWSGIKIAYWIVTGLLVLLLGWASSTDILQPQALADGAKAMGFPLYAFTLLGIAKLLALVAILIPGYPRVKEWAYAGLVFMFTGAVYSHIAAGQGLMVAIGAFVYLVFTVASYTLWRKLEA